jgi:hypothetical protein
VLLWLQERGQSLLGLLGNTCPAGLSPAVTLRAVATAAADQKCLSFDCTTPVLAKLPAACLQVCRCCLTGGCDLPQYLHQLAADVADVAATALLVKERDKEATAAKG